MISFPMVSCQQKTIWTSFSCGGCGKVCQQDQSLDFCVHITRHCTDLFRKKVGLRIEVERKWQKKWIQKCVKEMHCIGCGNMTLFFKDALFPCHNNAYCKGEIENRNTPLDKLIELADQLAKMIFCAGCDQRIGGKEPLCTDVLTPIHRDSPECKTRYLEKTKSSSLGF